MKVKSLSRVQLWRPHGLQPTRLLRPWDFPGKNIGVGCHFLLQWMQVKSESEVAQLCPTLAMPWTKTCQAPLSMRSSRKEYWSMLLCPPPGDLPDPGMEPVPLMPSALAGRFFTTSATWGSQNILCLIFHKSLKEKNQRYD